MKKILLIPATNVFNKRIGPYMPLGLLSLQAIAADYRDEIDIMNFDYELCTKVFSSSEELAATVVARINLDEYDTIGFSCKCNSFHHSLRIAQLIKQQKPNLQICMGGPHATAVAGQILANFPEIDAIFYGESENTIKTVLARRAGGDISLDGVPGVMVRGAEFIEPELVQNLDELPDMQKARDFYKFLDMLPREILPNGDIGDRPEEIPIEAARGCPCRCTFCSTRLFWGDNIRYKSNERIISEMNSLSEKTGCRNFSFIGDNFASIKKNLLSFCNYLIDNKHDYVWRGYLRLNCLEKEDFETLWKSGCKKFFVGVESASVSSLKKIKKSINLEREIGLIKHAISLGFEVETSFIIGFPWETKEDIAQTFELHSKLLEWGVDRSDIRVLCPLPGTELLDNYEVAFDRIKSTISYDDLAIDEAFDAEIIKKHPDMFCHFGYYKNDNITRFELIKLESDAALLKLKALRNRRQGL